MNENFVKTMDGTGAAIDVYCGFVPAHVRVVNVESAGLEQIDWYTGMADASAIKTVTGAGAAVDPRTKIAAGGITLLDDANGLGFRIGVDADINVAGEAIVIIAERGGEGNQAP